MSGTINPKQDNPNAAWTPKVSERLQVEVDALRAQVAALEVSMSDALNAWDTTTLLQAGDQRMQECMEGVRAALFPNCTHEKRRITQQGVTYADWRCERCNQYGRSSWD